jgi:hypothetical protein
MIVRGATRQPCGSWAGKHGARTSTSRVVETRTRKQVRELECVCVCMCWEWRLSDRIAKQRVGLRCNWVKAELTL